MLRSGISCHSGVLVGMAVPTTTDHRRSSAPWTRSEYEAADQQAKVAMSEIMARIEGSPTREVQPDLKMAGEFIAAAKQTAAARVAMPGITTIEYTEAEPDDREE